MSSRWSLASWSWRVLACTLVLVVAQMSAGPLVAALGLEPPAAPGEVDASPTPL